jgi:hypothetical protein
MRSHASTIFNKISKKTLNHGRKYLNVCKLVAINPIIFEAIDDFIPTVPIEICGQSLRSWPLHKFS